MDGNKMNVSINYKNQFLMINDLRYLIFIWKDQEE